MTLLAAEACAGERAHQLARELGADHPRAEAQHVEVVVLDALMCGVPVVDRRCTHARQLRRGDGHAGAGAADEHRRSARRRALAPPRRRRTGSRRRCRRRRRRDHRPPAPRRRRLAAEHGVVEAQAILIAMETSSPLRRSQVQRAARSSVHTSSSAAGSASAGRCSSWGRCRRRRAAGRASGRPRRRAPRAAARPSASDRPRTAARAPRARHAGGAARA